MDKNPDENLRNNFPRLACFKRRKILPDIWKIPCAARVDASDLYKSSCKQYQL